MQLLIGPDLLLRWCCDFNDLETCLLNWQKSKRYLSLSIHYHGTTAYCFWNEVDHGVHRKRRDFCSLYRGYNISHPAPQGECKSLMIYQPWSLMIRTTDAREVRPLLKGCRSRPTPGLELTFKREGLLFSRDFRSTGVFNAPVITHLFYDPSFVFQ